jgi:hypothetical protein
MKFFMIDPEQKTLNHMSEGLPALTWQYQHSLLFVGLLSPLALATVFHFTI